jgi:8-oxo-dGTP pyrophosphatase MutT (NUDIX family)
VTREQSPGHARHVVGVFVCIFDAVGQLLLLHRTDYDMWCLPGGLVEVGESLEQAAVRECLEETGLATAVTGLLGVYSDPELHLFRTSKGVRQYVTAVFLGRPLTGEPASFSHESRDLGFFPRADLPRLVPSHTIWIHDAFRADGAPYIR